MFIEKIQGYTIATAKVNDTLHITVTPKNRVSYEGDVTQDIYLRTTLQGKFLDVFKRNADIKIRPLKSPFDHSQFIYKFIAILY